MTADESDMCLDVYVWMISILILIHHQRMVFIFASLIISIHMLTLFSTHTSHYLLIQFHFSLFTLVSYTVATHVRSYALLLVSLSCYASHFCFLFRGVFVIFIGPELRWLEDICRHVLRHELRCVSATEYESIASNTIKPPVRTNQKHPLNLFIHSWSHLLP